MLARQFRLLAKIRDKKTLLRTTSRRLTFNLKTSTCVHSIELHKLNRDSFCIENVRNYSNISEVVNQTQNEESDSDVENQKIAKKYRVTENTYSYSYLVNNEKYKKTIIPSIIPDEDIAVEKVEHILSKQYENPECLELIEDFRILSYHAKLTNGKFTSSYNKILDNLTITVKNMADDQIWMLLRYIEMWYPMQRHNKNSSLLKLEEELDHQCWKRALDWDANELLMTCDLFYHLRRFTQSKLIHCALKKLGLKPSKMSADNYVHYMFLLNICRKPSINMYELEYRLESCIEEFTPEELAMIAMGFFKTQTPIRNPALTRHIVQKVTDNMKNLGEIFITTVAKMARLSVHMRDRDIHRQFFQKFRCRIPSSSIPCLVHIAHTGATALVYEKDAIADIIDELTRKGLAEARLKDIERLLFSLMVFNVPRDHPLYGMAVEQLKESSRSSEREKFHLTFSSALMYLSMVNIYPLDIITKILSPDYLKTAYKNNAFRIGREYLTIECGLKIEVPEYEGPFLSERIYNYIAKKHACDVVWRENPTERAQTYQKFLFEIVYYLKKSVGEKNHFIDQVLPHYRRADIIFGVDSQNNFIQPQPILTALPTFKIKYAPDISKGYKWFALVLTTHNHLFYYSNEMAGATYAKLRQLKACGYTPITMPITTWNKVKEPEKAEYLKKIIMEKIISDK